MPQTNILKLIFHHDRRMDDLAPSSNPSNESNPLAMFTQPDPTYSTLYFSGSDLENERFGLNTLSEYQSVIEALNSGLGDVTLSTQHGAHNNLGEALQKIAVNEAMIIAEPGESIQPEIIHSFTGKVLRDMLEKGWIVLYKREASDGFDIHMFSKENVYTRFFHPLKKLLPEAFRFFSINGKRLSSERQFYFETWALHKPPHGFEEVFPETVL